MSFGDRIGCAPQLVTACVALAAVIASGVYVEKENKKRNVQISPKHSAVVHPILVQTVFVNSGTER
jgi:hypothetical protein